MARPKGLPKSGGRQTGSLNKTTLPLRELINDFLGSNWQQMQTDFKALDPKDRLMFYEKILSYGLPKLQSTTLTTDFEKMTDEQLDYIISELSEKADANDNDA